MTVLEIIGFFSAVLYLMGIFIFVYIFEKKLMRDGFVSSGICLAGTLWPISLLIMFILWVQIKFNGE